MTTERSDAPTEPRGGPPSTTDDPPPGAHSLDAWRMVRTMLDDMTAMVQAEAETELELVEGLRVLGRVTALCSELSLDVDVEAPWFFRMNTEARYVGGPNPDGAYHLAMIDGHHRYRISGSRGTGARHRSTRHTVLERHGGEHLARVHRRPSPSELTHQRDGRD
jgi:hypothetical protein